ncbi:hypothetical protein RRG08_026510 [Elysia crispata]|uniref:Mutator-like transposase domain-containing protein n=1 Tax=Elysia crispata TaxID=231223 RepID=A0AAE0Y4A9_9GAST|nr:hypothetical protein RRG08_026510 [Elysia crispata]
MPKKKFQRQQKHLEKARAQRRTYKEGDLPDEPDFPPPTVRDSPSEQPQQSTEQPGMPTPFHIKSTVHSTSTPRSSNYSPVVAFACEPSDVKRTIVELSQINKLCHECLSDEGLKLQTPTRYGLAVKIEAACNACGTLLSSQFTSARNATSSSHPKPFVTNEATVMASLSSGRGPYSFNNFCEFLEMPGLHQKTFSNIAKRLYSQNERPADQVFSKAATLVRREHIRQFALDVSDEDVIDVSVSFDGSWLTRGHKFLIGIGCVIDVLIGLILDGHVSCLQSTLPLCAQSGAFVKRKTRRTAMNAGDKST